MQTDCDRELIEIKNLIEQCMGKGMEQMLYPKSMINAAARMHFEIKKIAFEIEKKIQVDKNRITCNDCKNLNKCKGSLNNEICANFEM